jgi:hypothetical protein
MNPEQRRLLEFLYGTCLDRVWMYPEIMALDHAASCMDSVGRSYERYLATQNMDEATTVLVDACRGTDLEDGELFVSGRDVQTAKSDCHLKVQRFLDHSETK